MDSQQINTIKQAIHTVPNYPIEGIFFRDVTGVLDDAEAFALTIQLLVEKYKDKGFTKVVGTEARGFLFGAPLALALGVGFVPVRKPGKLPKTTYTQSYQLEYGKDTLEIHQDALVATDKVLIIDDLLATGGTIEATIKLIRKVGADASHAGFVISLPELGGEEKLAKLDLDVYALVEYEGK